MRRVLSAAALTFVFLSAALAVLTLEEWSPGTPALAEGGGTDAAGRKSPLEARLIEIWVSAADHTSTLEYTLDGRLVERTDGSVRTTRFRVIGPNQYEIYDPAVGQTFRFGVQFTDPDQMTVISEGGMQTEWRRARDPG
jgi:YD repeat-containing protein